MHQRRKGLDNQPIGVDKRPVTNPQALDVSPIRKRPVPGAQPRQSRLDGYSGFAPTASKLPGMAKTKPVGQQSPHAPAANDDGTAPFPGGSDSQPPLGKNPAKRQDLSMNIIRRSNIILSKDELTVKTVLNESKHVKFLWTERQKAAIQTWDQAGATHEAIAGKFKVSRAAISILILAMKQPPKADLSAALPPVPRKNKHIIWTSELDQFLLDKRAEGLAPHQISALFPRRQPRSFSISISQRLIVLDRQAGTPVEGDLQHLVKRTQKKSVLWNEELDQAAIELYKKTNIWSAVTKATGIGARALKKHLEPLLDAAQKPETEVSSPSRSTKHSRATPSKSFR